MRRMLPPVISPGRTHFNIFRMRDSVSLSLVKGCFHIDILSTGSKAPVVHEITVTPAAE